jgi:predicted ATP-grasp superfamily ATP-dependent carboligase
MGLIMKNEIGVVLTGGDFQGLAALRAFSRKNIPVVLLDNDHCISRYSRCKHKFIHAPPPSESKAYIHFLLELAVRENLQDWLLIPNSDELVYLLSTHRDVLQKYYRIPVPPWDVIKNVYVKKHTYQLAEELGVDIPRSYFPENEEELRQLDLQYPVIIKPSIRDHLYQKVHVKAYRANDLDELIKIYQNVCQLIDPSEVVVQDLIPGGADVLYSFCPFFKNGEVLASITAKRSRQHPMTFGHASTFAELVSVPELKAPAVKFLQAIGYYGLCEVEFMYDRRDGRYRFLEVNPRIWGWHGLAIAAGVNLPGLLYDDMLGRPLEPCTPVSNLKWIRMTTDIPVVLGEIIKGRMRVKDYLSSMKGAKTFAVFAKNDPMPFIAELVMLPYLAVKKGF